MKIILKISRIARWLGTILVGTLQLLPGSAEAKNYLDWAKAPLPVSGIHALTHSGPEPFNALLRGMEVEPSHPLAFQFILERNRPLGAPAPVDSEETARLIRYFLTALTIPEKDLWVNLSPLEKDRIIPELFGMTEMGRDLLFEDYQLKKLTSNLLSPSQIPGQKFWDSLTPDATINEHDLSTVQFQNRIWIVPDKAVIYQNTQGVFILESRLKVLLEEDRPLSASHETPDNPASNSDQISLFRQIIIPEIEREINESSQFIRLRQIFHSLILAKWFKQNLQKSLLNQTYTDKNKINGLEISDLSYRETTYQDYLSIFQNGPMSEIVQEYNPISGEIITKKYISGGARLQTTLQVNPHPLSSDQVTEFSELDYLIIRGIFSESTDPAMNTRTEDQINQQNSHNLTEARFEAEQSLFDQTLTQITSYAEAIENMTGNNRMTRRKAIQQEIAEMLKPLTRNGLPLFPGKAAEAVSRKRNLTSRLMFWKTLAGIKKDDDFLFRPSQIINIIINYSPNNENRLKDEIEWLQKIQTEDNEPMFDGYAISRIILSSTPSDEKREFIEDLLRLRNLDNTSFFDGFGISQILRSGASIKSKKETIARLKDFRDEEEKPLFDGTNISLMMLNSSSSDDKINLIEILQKYQTTERKSLFNGSQISQIVYSGMPLEEKKILINYLTSKNTISESPIFNGSHIAQIIHSGWSTADKMRWIDDLSSKTFPDGSPIFDGYHLSQMILGNSSFSEKMSLINFLLEHPQDERIGRFNGSAISRIVISSGSTDSKISLIQDLLAMTDPGGGPLFESFAISQIIYSSASIDEKMRLIGVLTNIFNPDEKPLFNGSQISKIIYSGLRETEKLRLLDKLREYRDPQGHPVFNGTQISEIFLAKGTVKNRLDLITLLLEPRTPNGNFVFNGFSISRIVRNPQTIKNKKDLLEFLIPLKNAGGSPLLSDAQIADIITQPDSVKNKITLIRYLMNEKLPEGQPRFGGFAVSRITLAPESITDKMNRLAFLIRQRDENDNPLFDDRQITWIMEQAKSINQAHMEDAITVMQQAKANSDWLLSWILSPQQTAANLIIWASTPYEEWTTQARRRLARSIGKSAPAVDAPHFQSLAKIFLSQTETEIFNNFLITSKSDHQERLQNLSRVTMSAQEIDQNLRILMLSIHRDIRKQTIGQIYHLLTREILNAQKKYGALAADLFDEYLSRYDWSRPEAGLTNLKTNYHIILRNRDAYAFWLNLPSAFRKPLQAMLRLERAGHSPEYIENFLIRRRGWSRELLASARNFKINSLDQSVFDTKSLYDFIADDPLSEDVEAEDEYFDDMQNDNNDPDLSEDDWAMLSPEHPIQDDDMTPQQTLNSVNTPLSFDQTSNPGGIDFNLDIIPLQTVGVAPNWTWPANIIMKNQDQTEVNGLFPVIHEISPLLKLPDWLDVPTPTPPVSINNR